MGANLLAFGIPYNNSHSSPQACGGVRYSFEGFFGRKDFVGLDLPLWATGCLGRVTIHFHHVQTLREHAAAGFGGWKRSLLILIPP